MEREWKQKLQFSIVPSMLNVLEFQFNPKTETKRVQHSWIVFKFIRFVFVFVDVVVDCCWSEAHFVGCRHRDWELRIFLCCMCHDITWLTFRLLFLPSTVTVSPQNAKPFRKQRQHGEYWNGVEWRTAKVKINSLVWHAANKWLPKLIERFHRMVYLIDSDSFTRSIIVGTVKIVSFCAQK